MTLSAAHIAFLSVGSTVLPGTDRVLLFGGQTSVTIPAGGFVASDAVVERVPIFSDLVISMALPAQAIPVVTFHGLALQTAFFARGEQTGALELSSPELRPPGLGTPNLAAPVQAPVGEKNVVDSPQPSTVAVAAPTPPLVAQSQSWFFLKDVEVDAGGNPAPSYALVIPLQTAMARRQKPTGATRTCWKVLRRNCRKPCTCPC